MQEKKAPHATVQVSTNPKPEILNLYKTRGGTNHPETLGSYFQGARGQGDTVTRGSDNSKGDRMIGWGVDALS